MDTCLYGCVSLSELIELTLQIDELIVQKLYLERINIFLAALLISFQN